MHAYVAKYSLRNGARGSLHVTANNTCGVVIRMLDLFGSQLRGVSVSLVC
jgi:hypothetical protein